MRISIPTRVNLLADLEARDGYSCMYPNCKIKFSKDNLPTLDHWMPQMWCLAQGWTPDEIWDLSNLKMMHKSCNAKKGHLVPNPDGTLPKRDVKTKIAKSQRPEFCETCGSGRLLLIGEICDDCGSVPQPISAPKALQVSPKECDHDNHHCWMCFIGYVPRKSALSRIIGGP